MMIAPTELDSDILFDTMHLDPTETSTVRASAEQPASFHDAAAGRSSGAAPREAGAATAAAKGGVGLSLRGLSKAYAARQVLADIDLELAAGEFVAVVGRSGCGKSTLLRTIAQLEQASGGRIVYGDGARPPDMRIMFQEARLLPWKSVLQNVALGLPKASAGAAAALATVGLGERGGDWPAALSGGQRQRVALARALVHQPQLLLLDEPLGALDALTRIEMQQLIESLWLARGFTAVLVTHDVQEAVALADRVILIEDGRISVDARIDLPRPRARGSAAFAALEQRILAHVLKTPALEETAVPLPPLSRLKWAI